MHVRSAGHGAFAAALIVVGSLGLRHGVMSLIGEDLTPRLAGVPALVDACDLLFIACGAGLLLMRTAAAAARTLLGFVLLWLVALKLRYVLSGPFVEGSYQSCGEAAAILAGAWVLYASLATPWERQHLRLASGDIGLRLARGVYALALIAFGASHFAYLALTARLVPSWLPWHTVWACFTGAAYLAAAAAILLDRYASLAAALCAVQMGAFTSLVWVPVILAGKISRFDWNELFLSATLTAAGWIVADSYRGARSRTASTLVARSEPARR